MNRSRIKSIILCSVIVTVYVVGLICMKTMKEHIQDWDALGTAADIALFLILLLGVTWPQRRQEKYKERLDNFKKTYAALCADRNQYMDAALKVYKKKDDYTDSNNDPVSICKRNDAYLLYRGDWMNPQTGGKYRKLENIKCSEDPSECNKEATKKEKKFPDMDESYAENMKYHIGKKMFNGRTYAFKSMTESDGTIRLTVQEGGYYDFYNTCEYLCFETVYAERIAKGRNKKKHKKDIWSDLRSSMPVRNKHINVFNTNNRFAGIGINTILILKNVWDDSMMGADEKRKSKPEDEELKPYFVLHRRSDEVAEGMNNYHVVPAGSYQPVLPKGIKDKNEVEPMVDTVLRELGEELLGFEEFYDLNDPELLQELRRMITPYFLGMGFEPLNTKMEILAAIVIDMKDLVDFDSGKAKPNEYINNKPLFWKKSGRKEYVPKYKYKHWGDLEKIEEKTAGGGTRYVPVYTENELENALNERVNYEGKISLVPFTNTMLKQYEKDMRSTASMKQIMRLLQEEDNRTALGIASDDFGKWDLIKVSIFDNHDYKGLANLLERKGIIQGNQKNAFVEKIDGKPLKSRNYYLKNDGKHDLDGLVKELTEEKDEQQQ